ncbi:MAG TPA: polysaccharide deacetylase family protein [Rhizomicrobium sp.]|jgi:peptidoglycan/xylan/chitin deacetylase (PgdA/CDA1 family)|nr:polysaccharide deacetylase family protein [Rhizomicrobium sp.]
MRLPLAAALALALIAPAAAGPKIAITFDDLPSHSLLPPGTTRLDVAAAIIAALKDAKTPPIYGFVNGLRLEDDPASAPVLQMWRDAGFPLANHTYSHMNLGQHTLEDWQADTLKNEAILAPLAGNTDWHWLRYPYLAEGDTLAKHTAARAFLAAQHYRIAAVTLSFDDYLWNDPYARCVAKHDTATIAQMETAWLAAAESSLAYYRDLSQQLYGRDIPYVLLMHLGAFDAHMLPRLLDLYRKKGVELVPLEDAERDPFYAPDTDASLPPGPVTLEQAMSARGVTFPARVVQVLPFATLCR